MRGGGLAIKLVIRLAIIHGYRDKWRKIVIAFWGKKVPYEVTIMSQNIKKDKNLYKIFHEIIY